MLILALGATFVVFESHTLLYLAQIDAVRQRHVEWSLLFRFSMYLRYCYAPDVVFTAASKEYAYFGVFFTSSSVSICHVQLGWILRRKYPLQQLLGARAAFCFFIALGSAALHSDANA